MSAYQDETDPRLGDEVVAVETVTVETDDANDADRLQEDIAQTRAEMSDTINAIQERLSPQRIGEQVRGQVREATIGRAEHMVSDVRDTARQAGGGILETIRENPVPAALAALGLGWLWMKRPPTNRNGWRPGSEWAPDYGRRVTYAPSDGGPYGYRDYGYVGAYGGYGDTGAGDDFQADDQSGLGDSARQAGQRAQQVAGQAVGAAQGAAGQAADAVQQAAGQARDSAQQLGAQVQHGALAARSGLEGSLEGSPLAVGAIAVAIGVAVGLAAPSSDFENQMMGETRDNVLHKAQETAQETLGKVATVAQHTATATKETAASEAQKAGLTANKA